MMTKGTFFLNETLRKGAPMITDVGQGCFMARARMPFPQGLQFLYKVFQGRPLADVYSHGFFIEKQSNAEQPSPQFHLTEEIQGIMRIMKGLMYMTDVSSRIDNAMTVVRDPTTDENSPNGEGWIMYNPIELDEKTLPALRQRLLGSNAYLHPKVGVDTEAKSQQQVREAEELREKVMQKVTTIVVPSRQTFGHLPFWMDEFPNARIIASGTEIPLKIAEEIFKHKTDEEKAAIMKRFTFVKPADVLTPVAAASAATAAANAAAAEQSPAAPIAAPRASSSSSSVTTDNLTAASFGYRGNVPGANKANGLDYPFPAPEAIIDPTNTKGVIPLIDGVALLRRVPGDALTNELVMMHKPSKSMACTDLFHGAYADYDALNTWMCRAWFKFNRNGDYKDARVLPLFRRRQIEAQNGGAVEKGGKGITPVAEFVKDLVASNDHFGGDNLEIICHSHGTPPSRDHARELLLCQYDLHTMEKLTLPDVDVTQTNLFSLGRV